MINQRFLRVQMKSEAHYRFSIQVEEENGRTLPLTYWKTLLFAWHDASFYGSTLEDDEKDTVFLPALTAMEYLARAPKPSLFPLFWGEDGERFQSIATELDRVMTEGLFMPDYESWRKGHGPGWKDVAGELDSFSKGWLTACINEKLEHDPGIRNAWHTLESTYPLLEGDHSVSLLTEEVWLERIGWQRNHVPFEVCLRLHSPEADGERWKLETILRDKDDRDFSMEWHDSEALPDSWKPFISRINDEETMWLEVAPEIGDDGLVRDHLSEEEAWLFLTDTSIRLAEAGVIVLLPSWWLEIRNRRPVLKARVNAGTDFRGKSFVGLNSLVNFDWKLSTGDLELSEEEFMSLVDEKRKLVNIRGKWIALDPSYIRKVQKLMTKMGRDGLNMMDVLEHELIGPEEEPDSDVAFEMETTGIAADAIQKLLDVKKIPEVPLPDSFAGELRPYQQKGLDWLVYHSRLGLGACLADDMGLGKTIQVIAYLQYLKENGETKRPSLVVCPTSVLGNWQKELHRFAPDLNVYLHYGPNRKKELDFFHTSLKADVVLTSYGHISQDREDMGNMIWSTVCLDEAQNIKNPTTKQAKAVRQLSADHRIALTGTPMENRLTELWSIFDFLNPGYLGSLNHFKKRFVLPIEKDNDQEKIAQVRQLVRPFLMRRTKQDEEVALNLPDKLEQKEYCPLTVEQASLYEQLVRDTFEQVSVLSGMQRRGMILAMLNRLKQVCDHPALYLKEEVGDVKKPVSRSSKMEKLVDLARGVLEQQESLLVFTQYVNMGKLIQQVLETEFGESALFLHGGVPKAKRDQMIEDFQNGEKKVFVLSLKAGGTGLNLTAANHVIHYDRWWNPAVENQATDRAYRIGQKRFVHVHKLVTSGTLEERIDEMLERKQALNNEIIQSEHWITELSDGELHELFDLQREWEVDA